ncbi:hypothetical protein BLNAU_13703 [Blattamonas nauphoetae]|uniref:Uncharacterized protein n=1 Tax=Blattamonas nauphoetae TaxID=2049346 RepID=A0ABQ9XKG4_9EUKA|nr:hypothetical protein BLNAU_13703 [Blattamonas nauphoetae]
MALSSQALSRFSQFNLNEDDQTEFSSGANSIALRTKHRSVLSDLTNKTQNSSYQPGTHPQDELEDARPAVERFLSSLQDSSDVDVAKNIKELSHLVLEYKSLYSEPFLQLNGIDLLLLRIKDTDNSRLITSALILFSNLIESNHEVGLAISSSGLLTQISDYLTWNDQSITKECFFCLGNIAAESIDLVDQIVLNTTLYPKLVPFLRTDSPYLLEALFLFVNLSRLNREYPPFMELLPPLTDILSQCCTELWVDFCINAPETVGMNPLADCLRTLARLMQHNPPVFAALHNRQTLNDIHQILSASFPNHIVIPAIALLTSMLSCDAVDEDVIEAFVCELLNIGVYTSVERCYNQCIDQICRFRETDTKYSIETYDEIQSLISRILLFFTTSCINDNMRQFFVECRVVSNFERYLLFATPKNLLELHRLLDTLVDDDDVLIALVEQCDIAFLFFRFLTFPSRNLSLYETIQLFHRFLTVILSRVQLDDPSSPNPVYTQFCHKIKQIGLMEILHQKEAHTNGRTAAMLNDVLVKLNALQEEDGDHPFS